METKPQSGTVDASNVAALLSDLLLDAQVMQIEFRNDTGILGGIWIRGDQLIAAKIGDLRGSDAIEALLTQPDLKGYTAYRLNAKDTLGIEPIGSLSQMLDDLTFSGRHLVNPGVEGSDSDPVTDSRDTHLSSQSLVDVVLAPEVRALIEDKVKAVIEAETETVEAAEPEIIEARVEPEIIEAQVKPEVPEPEIIEARVEPEIIEARVEPEIIEARVGPEIIEARVEPEVIEARVEPEVIEAQVEPEPVLEAQVEPEVIEAQVEPELIQAQVVEPEIIQAHVEPEPVLESETTESPEPQTITEPSEAVQPEVVKPQANLEPKVINAAPSQTKKVKAQKILAVVSPKGGVGKTTMSLNLAVLYAQQGFSVILIDTDPQGGISNSLMTSDETPAGIYDVLMGRIPFRQALKNTRFDNLRLIPAGALLPEEVIGRSGQLSSPDFWKKVLLPIGKIADIVIIDTPAGVQGVTTPILTAATHVVAVSQPEPLSLRALGQLQKTMTSLEKIGPVAEMTGVIINMAFADRLVPLNILQTTSKGVINAQTILEPMLVRNDAVFKASISATPVVLSTQPNQQIWVSALQELSDQILQRLGLQTIETVKIEPLLV